MNKHDSQLAFSYYLITLRSFDVNEENIPVENSTVLSIYICIYQFRSVSEKWVNVKSKENATSSPSDSAEYY